jgi:hypothetical protein
MTGGLVVDHDLVVTLDSSASQSADVTAKMNCFTVSTATSRCASRAG